MPDDAASEKSQMLEALGAKVRPQDTAVPVLPNCFCDADDITSACQTHLPSHSDADGLQQRPQSFEHVIPPEEDLFAGR